MAADAKTNSFMLGIATVMVGAQADLHNLYPAAHSLGLVKNFAMTAEPSYTELTQGVKNTLVASVMTQNPVRASMEAYEFTARNLKWGLGLDGSSTATLDEATTASGQVVGDDEVVVVPFTAVDDFTAGDHVAINIDDDDNVVIRKIASIETLNVTLTQPIPTGITIPSGAAIKNVNVMGVGSKTDQPFLSAKAVGKLSDGTHVTILMPKIRVVRGFNLAFSTEDFGNMPFEFTVYDQVTSDPFYAEFGGDAARIFRT